jgi:hypothetical protein
MNNTYSGNRRRVFIHGRNEKYYSGKKRTVFILVRYE